MLHMKLYQQFFSLLEIRNVITHVMNEYFMNVKHIPAPRSPLGFYSGRALHW